MFMTWTVALTFIALSVLATSLFHRHRNAPFPPGPRPWPLIGNLTDLDARELWLRATRWADQYGAVVYLHVFGQGLVFINTLDAANELLDRRGAIYSDRVPMVMASELCGAGDMVAFTRYGDTLRRQRRLMGLGLSMAKVRAYCPLIEASTRPFLRSLLEHTDDRVAPIRQYAGGLNLRVVYGLDVTKSDDPCLMKVESVTELLANHIAGGGLWLVDVFPTLKHVPAWMPGAGFKRKAARWKKEVEESVDLPFEEAKKRIRDGSLISSFCSTLLEGVDIDDHAAEEHDIKWTANSMYAASMDTTITLVMHFFLAMMQHPAILRRAQTELDTVLGPGPRRLPTFSDRDKLQYVEAVWEELLRFGAPVPLGLPHRLMEDNIYDGTFIPKGSIVFANIWAMLRDSKVYPNPYEFDPDRFLDKIDQTATKRHDPRAVVFGFGRRRCPGNHLVESSIWLLIATMLAVFDIRKPIDADGVPVEPHVVFENLVFRTPSPFRVDIAPRSPQAEGLIYEGQ